MPSSRVTSIRARLAQLSCGAGFKARAKLGLLLTFAGAAAGLAGCAQAPQQMAHSSEYFPASVYGRASARVIADGQPIPHGGGTYLVGKPYTIAGHTYYPSARKYAAVGLASWYGDAFHGRRTANGEIYDSNSISAAHPTMPLPSYARVTNLRNNHSMIVRVNDRGPYAPGRIMDVSRRVADALDFRRSGTAKVKVEYIGPASLAGSDNHKLLATLRDDGQPATLNGEPVMVAQAPAAPVRTAMVERETRQASMSDVASDMPQSPLRAVPASTLALNGHTPLPPSRPYDLETIPGAGVPIAVRQRTAMVR